MSWSFFPGDGNERHVIPNFGREHERCMECWCTPKRDTDDADVIVHWAHDNVVNINARDSVAKS